MAEPDRRTLAWTDLLWLAFLGGLALLPPVAEVHKQLTLVAIGAFQIFEHRFLRLMPSRGPAYSVIIKILLGTLLLDHTEGISSSYYLIYFVPVATAAMYFDAGATLLWTALTSCAYCSLLIPALYVYTVEAADVAELALRNVFFFLAGVVVNRFVTERRREALRYRQLAEELAETNRRLAQAQEEARRSERLAALGQLSAGLAHELRNPLAVIKGSAETLTKKLRAADPLTVEVAGYISSEVNRLNAIVTRFLDFARPLKLERHLEQLPPLIERALKAARDRWPDTRVDVEKQYGENLPAVNVDPDLCEQVFTNLVLNAYEAMAGQGGRAPEPSAGGLGRRAEGSAPVAGKLRVRAAVASSNGRRGVEVEIEDSGPGVPPEFRQQIFNPFFTTKKEGVGLGLSIVSKIVDDHRGQIRVTEGAGLGACFRVFFPLE